MDCVDQPEATNQTSRLRKTGSGDPEAVSRDVCFEALMWIGRPRSLILAKDDVRFCPGFRMPAHRDGAACTGAGVRKPPKNEVAGSWAPAKQRPLSEFNAGAALDGKRDASMRRRAMSVQQRTAGELIDGVLLREAATRQNASTTSAFWHERCTRMYF